MLLNITIRSEEDKNSNHEAISISKYHNPVLSLFGIGLFYIPNDIDNITIYTYRFSGCISSY